MLNLTIYHKQNYTRIANKGSIYVLIIMMFIMYLLTSLKFFEKLKKIYLY